MKHLVGLVLILLSRPAAVRCRLADVRPGRQP